MLKLDLISWVNIIWNVISSKGAENWLTRIVLQISFFEFQPSHYDADSGIYLGPSRKLSDDESLLASLTVSEEQTRVGCDRNTPLPLEVDPESGGTKKRKDIL